MTSTSTGRGRPDGGLYPQVRLRHWGRWVSAVVLVALGITFLYGAAQGDIAYGDIPYYLVSPIILQGLVNTIVLAVVAQVSAIVIGIVIALMRISKNPVAQAFASAYTWLFRGLPVLLQILLWYNLALLFPRLTVGVPFTDVVFLDVSTNDIMTTFVAAFLGLALNESAYMAEIVRAGLLSVDKGQEEAAVALGMSWSQTMTRVILPQSMRVIIPPTGNEVISMLKTTSLVTAVPFSLELYTRSRDISAETFNPIPLLIVASIWYLFFTSILMVGQYFLEKRFSRGVGDRQADKSDAGGGLTGAVPIVGAAQPTVVLPPTPDQPGTPGTGGPR